jgi:hypothetical protein
MLFRIIAGASLTLALLFSGCATEKGMAVLDTPAAGSQSSKPVYLMTVTLRNTFVPAYQPRLATVRLQKKLANGNSTLVLVQPDLQARFESNSATTGCSYLLRMELEPGVYTLLGLSCLGQSMYTNGTFYVPIQARLLPSAPGFFYLGHIEATVRERKKNEFRAGPLLPSQEQSVTGASSGTFDVEITDQWETDSVKFETKFSALKGVNVQKDVLPPFNRARIQQWWDTNAFGDMP